MRAIHYFINETQIVTYRRELTGEKFGWVVHESPLTFVKVHQVHMHPEDGPVILVVAEVYEIDPDMYEVYLTEELAKDAYYK